MEPPWLQPRWQAVALPPETPEPTRDAELASKESLPLALDEDPPDERPVTLLQPQDPKLPRSSVRLTALSRR
jgi:hypothetical protein